MPWSRRGGTICTGPSSRYAANAARRGRSASARRSPRRDRACVHVEAPQHGRSGPAGAGVASAAAGQRSPAAASGGAAHQPGEQPPVGAGTGPAKGCAALRVVEFQAQAALGRRTAARAGERVRLAAGRQPSRDAAGARGTGPARLAAARLGRRTPRTPDFAQLRLQHLVVQPQHQHARRPASTCSTSSCASSSPPLGDGGRLAQEGRLVHPLARTPESRLRTNTTPTVSGGVGWAAVLWARGCARRASIRAWPARAALACRASPRSKMQGDMPAVGALLVACDSWSIDSTRLEPCHATFRSACLHRRRLHSASFCRSHLSAHG